MKHVLITLICSAAFAAVSAVPAGAVTVSGCAVAGVEAGCVVIKNGDKAYNVTAAKPKPIPGTYGTATGSVSTTQGICMQGIPLSPATWVPDQTHQCNQ